jgi:hypothetical protein
MLDAVARVVYPAEFHLTARWALRETPAADWLTDLGSQGLGQVGSPDLLFLSGSICFSEGCSPAGFAGSAERRFSTRDVLGSDA